MKEHLDKIPVCPIVVIEWIDHCEQSGWKDLEAGEDIAYVIRSAGFLICADKKYYQLAQSLNNYRQKDNTLHILKKDVISIKWLRGKKK